MERPNSCSLPWSAAIMKECSSQEGLAISGCMKRGPGLGTPHSPVYGVGLAAPNSQDTPGQWPRSPSTH